MKSNTIPVSTMVMIHDDYILFCTSKWIELKNIVERCGGDESEVVESIQRLTYMGFLESRTLKNNLFYKKQDTPQNHDQFSLMMDDFLEYQKFEIELIKKIPTIMLSDGGRFGFSKDGLKLLEHIQEEINRITIVISKIDHFDKIRLLQHPIAQQRIKRLQNHINRIMDTMLDSYKDVRSNVALQEYFKTHTGKLNTI